jgi:hypothetical protein
VSYYGDFRPGQTVRSRFNSINPSTGAPASISSGAVSVSKDGAVVTPSGGVAFTADADSTTGLNRVTIDTSVDTATFTAGSDYSVRLSAGTVAGISVVGAVIAEFSIANRAIALDANGKVSLAVTPPTAAEVRSEIDANSTQLAALAEGVTLDLTQSIPTTNTAQSLGDCLNAARAQGFGKWTKSGSTLTLYAADGTTVVRTFNLDDATNPTSRS